MPRTAVFEGTRYSVPDDASDQEIADFVEGQIKSKSSQPPAAGRPPKNVVKYPSSIGDAALGFAKGAARDAYSTVTLPSRAILKLEGIKAPGLEKPTKAIEELTEPTSPAQKVGSTAETVASIAAPLAGVAKVGLGAIKTAAAKDAAKAVLDTLPDAHPVARFIAHRIPGASTVLDIVEGLKGKFGSGLKAAPKGSRDELAFHLWKEKTGALPTTAKERVDAIKALKSELTTKPQAAKPSSPTAATTSYPFSRTPMAGADPRTAEASAIMAGNATAKDYKIGTQLLKEGVTPEDVAKYTDEQMQALSKRFGHSPYKGKPGSKGVSRSPSQGREQLVLKMRDLQQRQ